MCDQWTRNCSPLVAVARLHRRQRGGQSDQQRPDHQRGGRGAAGAQLSVVGRPPGDHVRGTEHQEAERQQLAHVAVRALHGHAPQGDQRQQSVHQRQQPDPGRAVERHRAVFVVGPGDRQPCHRRDDDRIDDRLGAGEQVAAVATTGRNPERRHEQRRVRQHRDGLASARKHQAGGVEPFAALHHGGRRQHAEPERQQEPGHRPDRAVDPQGGQHRNRSDRRSGGGQQLRRPGRRSARVRDDEPGTDQGKARGRDRRALHHGVIGR